MPRHDPDQAARWLREAGRLAVAMPPSWDGAKVSIPLKLPHSGATIGRILPGRGVVLRDALRDYGITRGAIPHVMERGLFERLRDATRGRERLAVALAAGCVALHAGASDVAELLRGAPLLLGAITQYDDIINARANGKAFDSVGAKASITTVANTWSSLLRAGGSPGAMTFSNIPGGSAMIRSNAGALNLGVPSPAGADKSYLLTFGFGAASTINWALLVDVLVMAGNINANATGAQTVNTTALTRYTSGAGVQMIIEVTTAVGATASNITVSYTDQDANAGASSGALAMTASAIASRLQPQATPVPFIPLASGDYGVRSVETATMSAAMGAGVLALILYYPLSVVPGVLGNTFVERDSTTQIDGLTELVDDGTYSGCLGLLVQTSTTTSGALTYFLRTAQG